ncbi:MAG TPA: DUF6084 family protein [Stellaceae bacterium]|nr:DUF6084 family protein [Stellaceae bacterium]
MIDLDFAIDGVEIGRSSAVPVLNFKLLVSGTPPTLPVEHVALQAQVRIEAAHRDYGAGERERLAGLFGGAADWDRSLRGLFWMTASAAIPAFEGECIVSLPVPCSCDATIAATKYFDAIEDGDAPLSFLFSGSVFYRGDDGGLQIAQIAHHKEAAFRLPVRLWREMMALYYPGCIWLPLGRDLFDEIDRYRRRHGLAAWEEALRRLVAHSRAEAM